ncbi:MAG: hypothetical protein KGN33_15445 [Paracoccaceae bacterium]|nr:hypothetical protein [Paracoccaceae bacterium]
MFGSKRIRELEESIKKQDEVIEKLRAKSWEDLKLRFGMDAMLRDRDLLIDLLTRALQDAIVLASGKDPATTFWLNVERGVEIKKQALERNDLKDSMIGPISHRFGRMTYKADYTQDGGAIVWEYYVAGEKAILGPVMDDDGDYIDYSSRVQQLEQKAIYNAQIEATEQSGEQ